MSVDASNPPSRIAAIDAARGLALVAMVAYHFAWDLQFLEMAAIDVTGDRRWLAFANAIAATFLALVGVGLVMAHRHGLAARAFWLRVGTIAAAAAAITVVTLNATPQQPIWFGILHCIAVSSVLALAFLRAPLVLVAAMAGLCIAAPMRFADPAFNAPALMWLGLRSEGLPTPDYVPLLPWFGMVLVGVVLGRLLEPRLHQAWARWRPGNALARALVWAGQRSLPIYLIHQPVLIGLLLGAGQMLGPNEAAIAAAFQRNCETVCAGAGTERAQCAARCRCVETALKADALWTDLLLGRLTSQQTERVTAITNQCRGSTPPRRP
jgi:uncharacterized membrane protein